MKSQLWGEKVRTALRCAQKWVAAALGAAAFFAVGTASAASVAEVGGAKYETLEAALGALNAQNSRLTLLSDAAWDAATPVYWKAGTKSGYAATLPDGLKSAFMADGGSITIVCRPGADVGGMTHGHVADDITIYGNKAYVSGGECDLEVDTYTVSRETEAQSSESGLAKDISITAYGLDNLGVWGERKTAHVVTISLNDCDGRAIDGVSGNVQRVYLSGEKAGVNNITLTDCDFITTACAVYSSVDGSLKVENCTFKNVHEPININHKTAGPMTVEVVGTTFTSCGTDGSNYAAPVRVVNSGAGTMSASVAACTFTDTVGANGDVLVGDGRDGKTSNAVSLTVSGTAANVQTQQPGCYAAKDFTILDATKRATKTVASTATVTATIDGTFKLTAIDFDAFIAALEDSNYVLDGSAHELAQNGRLTVKWSPASGCRDARAEHTCTAGGVKATGNTPHRLNAGLLQFQMFNGKDCAVSVKNVDFVYEPADCTVCANSGWAGTFTAAQASAGQIFIESAGDVAFENCTFDKTVLTSWGCTGATTVKNCVFKNVYDSYAVKDVRGETVEVTGCTFTDCGGAVMVSAADATKVTRVTVSTNAFENVDVAGTAAEGKAGTRGLVQIAAGGDYSGAQFVFAGNVANNCGPVVRQLNATVAFDATAKSDLSALVSDGQSLYTSDSKKPAVAKVGDVEYGSFEEALAAVQDGGTITLVDDVAVDAAIVASKCPTVASYTLDLNGRTLYAAAKVTLNKGDDAQTVTVKNGKFHATGSSGRFRAEDKATVTIENVEFTTDGSRIGGGPLVGVTEGVCVFQGWGKSENAFTFKGCTFTDCYVSIEGGAGTELSNDVDFINCQFKFTGEKYIENAVKVNYYVGGALDFSGCTFDVKNFAMNSSTVRNVTVIDCDSTAASGLSVTLDDTTVIGTTNEKGGSVSLIDVANKSTTTVALAGTTSVTVDGKKVESPVSGVVAKVGDIQYFTLAEALNAALAANDGVEFTTVEIVDDITFAEGDAWTPVVFTEKKRLEIAGNNKKVVNLPNSLLTTTGTANSLQRLRMSNLTFVNPKAENPNDYASAVIYGYADVLGEAAFNNVCIDGAKVSAKKHAGAFLGYVSLHDAEEKVTFTNCKVTNSRITSAEGSVGALAGHANGSYVGTVEVIDCEVVGNTIGYTTADEDGAIKAGAVFGSIGNTPVSVSANVSGNTVTAVGETVTTIYGRQGSAGGRLTLTGGTYDSAPFAEADATWAGVSASCAVSTETVGGKTVYTVAETAVATVGGTAYASLADAIEAALALNDGTPVEIQRDVTFAPGDKWTPPEFGGLSGRKLVINGNGKTIANLPGCLLWADNGDSIPDMCVLEINDLTLKDPTVHNVGDSAAVILGCALQMRKIAFKNVVIDGANVRNAGDYFTAGFVGYCQSGRGSASALEISFDGCALKHSLIAGGAATAGLIAYAGGGDSVVVRITDTEVVDNVIVTTELEDGTPRAGKVGAVIGTVDSSVPEFSATVTGNTVYAGYGTTDDADDTNWKRGVEVKTVYGRNTIGGITLSLTGGTYQYRPIAEADAAWAKVAEGCTLAGNDADGWTVAYFIKANGVGYATLEAAFAAAEPDADGVVTYEIGGKAEVRGENWIQILKSGLTGVSQVKFVGTTDDAEICLVTAGSILSEQAYDVDVTFTDLTLSRLNPAYVNDIGFGACYFSTWLRNLNAAENTVTYTRCTFPNGVCNNQYGKTFYNDCTFSNQQSGGDTGYNLWVYGGDVKVNGGTFTGTHGVKVYNEGDARDDISVSITGTTFDGLTEKSAILASKPCNVTVANVTVKDCAKGLFTRDIDDDEAAISANGTGISGTFAITSVQTAETAKKEFNLTGGTFTSAVDADYCAKGYEITANDDGTYGVTSHTVAKVGDREFNSLAEALTFALKQNDGVPVEIVDDITFDEGDTWTPVPFSNGETLVIKGNGKTISNMHGSLLGSHDLTVDAWNGSLTVTNLKFVDPKDSYTANGGSGAAVILPCAYGMDVTLDGVVIEGADIRAGTDSYVAGFVAWCNGVSGGGKKTVTLKNCAIRNSTLVSCGSVGGLVAYTTATSGEAVTLVVENCEVTGNTIVGTEIKNGAPRTDIVGSVVASIGAGGASVSAKVTGNSVYGSASAFDAETLTKDTDEVTTVYGRNQAGGTLTVTGGEYDHAPFADDATWASVAEWSKIVEQDGVYKVVDNPVTLGNVAARQRYPWNGLVDVTFELKSQKEVRLFIVAEYANGAETVRLPMGKAKLVNEDGTQTDVNVSDGKFKMAAQETAKTVHIVWDSTTAVPARQSGVTFKVYAK